MADTSTRTSEDDELILSLESLRLKQDPKQESLKVPKHLEKYISNSWIVFDPETESIDEWISQVKPSEVVISTIDVKWVGVHNPHESISEHEFCKEEYTKYLDMVTDEKKYRLNNPSAPDRIPEAKQRCLNGIMDVARKQKYTTGYWMLYEDLGNIDEAWSKVAKATAEGKLGCFTKVLTSPGKDHGLLICIYVSDYTNEDRVKNLLKAIVMMGFQVRSSFNIISGFKPDVYSSLGINTRNQWNLNPTIYHEMLSEVTSCPRNKKKPKKRKDVNANFKPITKQVGNVGVTAGKGIRMGVGTSRPGLAATTLFCYNIGPSTTEAQLHSLFSKYGNITVVDVKKDKAYGFVHMPDPYEAYQAMMALNGFFHNGKVMQVSVKTNKR